MRKAKMLKEVLGALVVVLAVFAFVTSVSAEDAAKAPAYVGAETCLGCHEDQGAELTKTKHGLLFKDVTAAGEKKGCEACHGAAEAHIEDSSTGVVRFGEISAADASAICLNCHSAGDRKDWRAGAHAGEDVSCISCHSPHGKQARLFKDKHEPETLLVDTQTDLCLSCHGEKSALINMPSHHPVKEGKVECSDCHSPHSNTLANMEQAGKVCINCHVEKAGPFKQEHQPAVESCVTCHNPHGSINQNLLEVREPALCLQCHAINYGDPVVPIFHDVASSHKNCTSAGCHRTIHGSNSTDANNSFTE